MYFHYLALFDGLKTCFLNVVGYCVELHVSQHHNGTQQQGCWIGFVLSGNVWCSAMDLQVSMTFVTQHYNNVPHHGATSLQLSVTLS